MARVQRVFVCLSPFCDVQRIDAVTFSLTVTSHASNDTEMCAHRPNHRSDWVTGLVEIAAICKMLTCASAKPGNTKAVRVQWTIDNRLGCILYVRGGHDVNCEPLDCMLPSDQLVIS
jgi:hypothetical protein